MTKPRVCGGCQQWCRFFAFNQFFVLVLICFANVFCWNFTINTFHNQYILQSIINNHIYVRQFVSFVHSTSGQLHFLQLKVVKKFSLSVPVYENKFDDNHLLKTRLVQQVNVSFSIVSGIANQNLWIFHFIFSSCSTLTHTKMFLQKFFVDQFPHFFLKFISSSKSCKKKNKRNGEVRQKNLLNFSAT